MSLTKTKRVKWLHRLRTPRCRQVGRATSCPLCADWKLFIHAKQLYRWQVAYVALKRRPDMASSDLSSTAPHSSCKIWPPCFGTDSCQNRAFSVSMPEVVRGDQTCLYFFSVFICVIIYLCYWWLFAFVVLGSVSSVLSQEIGWEERLQNDLFCVEGGVKP